MLTSPIVIQIRNLTRKMGINKWIGSLISSESYEDKFGVAFQNEIHAGDIVWDIGANVGLYTHQFREKSAPDGLVVAFEPTPSCFRELQRQFENNKQVVLKNWAVGESDGQITMAIEEDPLAATHRIILDSSKDNLQSVTVDVRSAISIIGRESHLFPNIVKIDVEGHEGHVIDGFSWMLSDPRLKCIGIEMHFGLLAERGESTRPKQMERLLADKGFTNRWTDASHLLATR